MGGGTGTGDRGREYYFLTAESPEEVRSAMGFKESDADIYVGGGEVYILPASRYRPEAKEILEDMHGFYPKSILILSDDSESSAVNSLEKLLKEAGLKFARDEWYN